MQKDNLDKLLSKRVKSPAPHLQADPFLPTRIEALADKKSRGNLSLTGLLANWSVASLLAAGAVMIGIYIGSGLTANYVASENAETFISEYSEAFYQSGFADDWSTAFENGESQ